MIFQCAFIWDNPAIRLNIYLSKTSFLYGEDFTKKKFLIVCYYIHAFDYFLRIAIQIKVHHSSFLLPSGSRIPID